MAGKFRKAFIRIKRSFRDVTKAGCDLGFSEMSSPTTHVCTPPTAGYTRWCMVSKRFKREATFKNGISLFSVEKNQRQIKCKKSVALQNTLVCWAKNLHLYYHHCWLHLICCFSSSSDSLFRRSWWRWWWYYWWCKASQPKSTKRVVKNWKSRSNWIEQGGGGQAGNRSKEVLPNLKAHSWTCST